MKRRRLICVSGVLMVSFVLLITLMSGCSTPFKSPEEVRKEQEEIQRRVAAFQEPPAPPPGHVLVYFYELSRSGIGTWSYYVDETKIASLHNKEFTWVYVKTGPQKRKKIVKEDGIIFNVQKVMLDWTFDREGGIWSTEIFGFRGSTSTVKYQGRDFTETKFKVYREQGSKMSIEIIKKYCDYVRPEVQVIP